MDNKIDILGESNKQDIQHTVSKGIGPNYLYFTKSPSAYGIPIRMAGMYENLTFTMASACCFCACFCKA